MLTYRGCNLAARGEPKPYAAIIEPDEIYPQEPQPANRVGRPPKGNPAKEWDYIAPVLLEIERWLRAKNMSASRFGKLAVGDPRLVFDLRSGRDPSSKLVARLRAYMQAEA